MKDVQVVVVGSGPAALLTARGLARAGISVSVLQDEVGADSSPVFCHWSVLPRLARLGVLDDLVAAALVERRWSFKVLGTGQKIVFDLRHLAGDVANPYNVHVGGAAFRAILHDIWLACHTPGSGVGATSPLWTRHRMASASRCSGRAASRRRGPRGWSVRRSPESREEQPWTGLHRSHMA